MTLTRDDLFAMAKAAGWKPGAKLTPAQRAALNGALTDILTGVIADAPKVFDAPNGRPMTVNDAASALIEELH